MQNPFAIAVQWPDSPRRFLVHLERPYFTAALFETAGAAWLAVSWAPGTALISGKDETVLRAAAGFCQTELGQRHVPIEFVEKQGGFQFPAYLIAQSDSGLFIVEPDHATPLVEVRESQPKRAGSGHDNGTRFDVVTEWRLAQMRKYYQQFLERQQKLGARRPSTGPLAGKK